MLGQNNDNIDDIRNKLVSSLKKFIFLSFIKIVMSIFLNSIASMATLLIEINTAFALIGLLSKKIQFLIFSLIINICEEILLIFCLVNDYNDKENFIVDEKKIFIWVFSIVFSVFNIFYFWKFFQIYLLYKKMNTFEVRNQNNRNENNRNLI